MRQYRRRRTFLGVLGIEVSAGTTFTVCFPKNKVRLLGLHFFQLFFKVILLP